MATESKRTLATYVLATALALLAGALVYFAVTLKQVVNALPPVVAGLQDVSGEIPPILERVDLILATTVPSLLAEVTGIREQVEGLQAKLPDVLTEVAAIREGTVPDVLAEVERIRSSIPPILERVASIQEQLPSILAEVEAVRGEVPSIVAQVEGIQTQIPDILAEVEAVRLAIPEYLEDANDLTEKVRTAGREASEGAVQGLFSGIIKAPVNMVSGFGSNFIAGQEFTEEGQKLFQDELGKLLIDPKKGASARWRNAKDTMDLELAITRVRGKPGERVVSSLLTAYHSNRKADEVKITSRENADGTWDTARDN